MKRHRSGRALRPLDYAAGEQVRALPGRNTREVAMIWLKHKKYTHDYVSGQLAEMCARVRRETRRMVMVATAAVATMAVVQATYLLELLAV
jgi:hypothetical protein